MSKFFDGLKKSDGAIAKLTIEAIGTGASPEPAQNGGAPHSLETKASQSAVEEAEQQAGLGFPFEDAVQDAVEGIRTLSGRSTWEDVTRAMESPGDKPLDAPQPDLPASAAAPLGHAVDADTAAPAASPEQPASAGSDTGSVVIRLRAGSPLLPFDTGEADVAAEEYRRVRTKILQHTMQPRLILVSSPAAGDGKSVTALNLAGALALNRDARVLLADMDLRRPTIAALLGVPERDGVAEVLAGSCSLEDAVVRLEPFPNLFLLPAGKDRRNPAELLSSPRWKALSEKFRSQMTYVVLDGPPVEAVAEYSLLQEFSDGVLFVVRKGHTIRSLLYRAVESIPKERLVGTIINGYRESFFWKQRNDYYY
jgi:protein-tyrosine kinase